MSPLIWDTEATIHDLGKPELHIRNSDAYLNRALKAEMDETYGSTVTHVRTRTLKETGEVLITFAHGHTPGARRLRFSRTMNAATFGFSVPLRKLEIVLPEHRQLILPVTKREIEGETVFVATVSRSVSVPRDIEEKTAAAKQSKPKRSKQPKQPDQPVQPVQPEQPEQPEQPDPPKQG